MKYANLKPHWHHFDGVSILTDSQQRILGYIQPIGSQIHREYIRGLKTATGKLHKRPP